MSKPTKPETETEIIDKLFLELSQFTKASTARELDIQARLVHLLTEVNSRRGEYGADGAEKHLKYIEDELNKIILGIGP